MKKAWLLLPLIAVLAALAWLVAGGEINTAELQNALGIKSTSAPAQAKSKPICSQAIVPTGADCIPQHMANLPPDPGEAGKATIDGIDADKDGVRDDVQRFIHETWPDSERTRQVLFQVAKAKQTAVHYGDSLGREETQKLMPDIMRKATCYIMLDEMMQQRLTQQSASEKVQTLVTNTKERWERAADFSYQLAHQNYDAPDDNDLPALCGFDPAALPN